MSILNFWPTVIGVIVLGAAISLSGDKKKQEDIPSSSALSELSYQSEVSAEKIDMRRKISSSSNMSPVISVVQPTKKTVKFSYLVQKQVQEVPKKRTLKFDDEDVKEALKKVNIEIFSPMEVGEDKMAQYLSHNDLMFSYHDTNSPMEKAKARRLSPGGHEKLMIIDGKVVKGFSQKELENEIAIAIERRVSP